MVEKKCTLIAVAAVVGVLLVVPFAIGQSLVEVFQPN